MKQANPDTEASSGEADHWRALMAFGLGQLRLSPDAFWSMTPREIAAAAHHLTATSPSTPTRETLSALMHDNPDTRGKT